MILTFRLTVFLVTLPVRLVIYIIKGLFRRSRYRKYRYRLWDAVNLALIAKIFSFNPYESLCFSFYKAKLISYVYKKRYRKLLKKYFNYNSDYDENSFWLKLIPDRKSDDPIIIYLHGGGYKFQMGPGQLEALIVTNELISPAKASKLSILIMDYALAGRGYKYPIQMIQLHQIYNRLTIQEGNTNIIVMGDSAGSHLILCYLQYLQVCLENKQLTNVIYPKHLFLISPWLLPLMRSEHAVEGHSSLDNDGKDYLSRLKYDPQSFFKVFGVSNVESLLVSPGVAPIRREDWSSISTFKDPKSSIFVIFGEDEIFRDDVIDWCNEVLGVSIKRSVFQQTTFNKFDPTMHEHIIENSPHQAKSLVYIEPWGVHDSSFLFEGGSLLSNIQTKKGYKLEDVDREKYFGLYRIAKHLDDVL